MKKILLFVLCISLLSACSSSLQSAVKNGEIIPTFNDTLLTDDYLWVRGFGAVNSAHSSDTQKKILSREAAIANAYQRLSEEVYGTNVDANIQIVDAVSSNSSIHSSTTGLIQYMELVSTEYLTDGGCTVIMRIRKDYIKGMVK